MISLDTETSLAYAGWSADLPGIDAEWSAHGSIR